MLKIRFQFYLTVTLCGALANAQNAGASQRYPAGSYCMAPAFEWLSGEKVHGLRAIMKTCHDASGETKIATRVFEMAGVTYYLLVNAQTLETRLAPEQCLQCENTTLQDWKQTRFARALITATTPQKSLYNNGVRRAEKTVDGYFMTVDLCPSRKPGFDEEIFAAMETLRNTHRPPIAIAITGLWIQRHRQGFEWLLEQQKQGKLKITWMNHTYSHPFSTSLPDSENYLLEKGVRLDREILGLERLLLESGVIPSVFFRFPGLVSSPALLEELKEFLLIPIGSDAWLAKNESPHLGSIILIHGNENEPRGVGDFLRWLGARHNKNTKFLELESLF